MENYWEGTLVGMLDKLQEHGCYRLNEALKRESRVERPYSIDEVPGLILCLVITQA
jgi:hypothetical protein